MRINSFRIMTSKDRDYDTFKGEDEGAVCLMKPRMIRPY